MTAPVENLEKLLASGKDGALLRFGLGNAYVQAQEWPRAIEHLRRAVHDLDGRKNINLVTASVLYQF